MLFAKVLEILSTCKGSPLIGVYLARNLPKLKLVELGELMENKEKENGRVSFYFCPELAHLSRVNSLLPVFIASQDN